MRPLLLDTMTVLWMCFRPDWLGKDAARVLGDNDQELFYSIVNLWEIGIKMGKGKYPEFILPKDWHQAIPDSFSDMKIPCLEIAPHHCRRVQNLPFHHKDPFDRMLIAQALENDLDMVSTDETVEKYGIRRVW